VIESAEGSGRPKDDTNADVDASSITACVVSACKDMAPETTAFKSVVVLLKEVNVVVELPVVVELVDSVKVVADVV
jgi:hypothetical protein